MLLISMSWWFNKCVFVASTTLSRVVYHPFWSTSNVNTFYLLCGHLDWWFSISCASRIGNGCIEMRWFTSRDQMVALVQKIVDFLMRILMNSAAHLRCWYVCESKLWRPLSPLLNILADQTLTNFVVGLPMGHTSLPRRQ